MTGFHGTQSGFKRGDEMQEGAGICEEDPAGGAGISCGQEQMHHQQRDDLLPAETTCQLAGWKRGRSPI